jgi:hypothetical protein
MSDHSLNPDDKTIADVLDEDKMAKLVKTLKDWDILLEKMYESAPEEYKRNAMGVDFNNISPEDIGLDAADDVDIWKSVREQMAKK